MSQHHERDEGSTLADAAVAAYRRGYVPIRLREAQKRPAEAGWERAAYENEDQVREHFRDAGGVGVLLGEPSGGLIDVDVDHPKAERAAPYVLPDTGMMSGRPGNRWSHYWYVTEDIVPPTRRWALPDGEVLVELRSTGAQTVVPPSTHPTGERYLWEQEPWGGDDGAERIDAVKLQARVATLALIATLLDAWPNRGRRHDAYLALAGGLLRGEDGGVHALWRRNADQIIGTLATVTRDEDGARTRIRESVPSTIERLEQRDGLVQGWPSLAKIIGDDHVDAARRAVREIETVTNHTVRRVETGDPVDVVSPPEPPDDVGPLRAHGIEVIDREDGSGDDDGAPTEDAIPRDALEHLEVEWDARLGQSWVSLAETTPRTLPWSPRRTDGLGLTGPAMLVSMYGAPESGKSLLSADLCATAADEGGIGVYLSLDASPRSTAVKLLALARGRGLDDDALRRVVLLDHRAPLPYDVEGKGVRAWRAMLPALRHLAAPDAPVVVAIDHVTALARVVRERIRNFSLNDAENVAAVLKPWGDLARQTDTTIVVLDHASMKGEGTTPLGSTGKIGEVDLAYRLVTREANRPTPWSAGIIDLYVGKDREGYVQEFTGDEDRLLSRVHVTPDPDDRLTRVEYRVPDRAPKLTDDGQVEPPPPLVASDGDGVTLHHGEHTVDEAVERADGDARDRAARDAHRREIREVILALLDNRPGLAKGELLDAVRDHRPESGRFIMAEVLEALVSEGMVRVRQDGPALRHYRR